MSIKNVLKPIAMRTFNSAALTGAGNYALITAASGLEVACVYIRIINTSNTLITVSFDGLVGHDVIPANTALPLQSQVYAQPNGYSCLFGRSQLIYIAGVAGVGTIYLTGYFQPGI
jgi:hypothetical protein